MKTISEYTIYCTEEQTKKALKLGASLEYTYDDCGIRHYINPTAEQMIGWLEEKIDNIDVLKNNNGKWIYLFYPTSNSRLYECKDKFLSRPEATLAAIDAALDYLIKKQEVI